MAWKQRKEGKDSPKKEKDTSKPQLTYVIDKTHSPPFPFLTRH
jgi:hypothetical protein